VHNDDTWIQLRGELDKPENKLVQSVLRLNPGFRQQVHDPIPEGRSIYRNTLGGLYRAQVFHSNSYLRRV
jgi:hypothetical protein